MTASGSAASPPPSRPRLRIGSVRLRLTLWNVLILALTLALTGIFLRQSVRQSLLHTIDDGLLHRAQQFQEMWQNPAEHAPTGSDTGGHDAYGWHGGPAGGKPPGPDPRDDGQRPNVVTAGGIGYFSGRPETVVDREGLSESLQSGQPVYRTLPAVGKAAPVRVLTVSLPRRAGEEPYALQATASLASQVHEVNVLTRGLLAVVPLALLTAGIGAAFLTDRALRPVRAVTRAASGVGAARDLSARLTVSGSDEFSQLASTFNGMLSRLEATFGDLERAYEQQRRFVADASHELRTPLTIIKANTSLALSDPNLAPDVCETLTEIDRGVDRTTRIVQDLFLLARSDSGYLPLDRHLVDLPHLLGSVISQLGVANGGGNAPAVRLAAAHSSPLFVQGDSSYLERLFRNLIENAARHTPADGTVDITLAATDAQVEVRIVDTGEGIAPEHLPQVMERFYRVDSARARTDGGTGLGLPIAVAIAHAHGGAITLTSLPGQGTAATVTLPRSAASEPSVK